MARKYNLISELYDRTCKTVVANPQNWQNFLQSACRNYKLRYDEQLLIYAQRPDATAVLEIERWNRNFGRLSRDFRIGYGQTPNEGRNSRDCITKSLIVFDRENMMEAISFSVV